MSRFAQLAIGHRFEFEGEIYVKSTPLLAVMERSGGQRLIPRAALVRSLEKEAAPETPKAPQPLTPALVKAGLDEYHARCVTAVESLRGALDPLRVQALLTELDVARAACERRLLP